MSYLRRVSGRVTVVFIKFFASGRTGGGVVLHCELLVSWWASFFCDGNIWHRVEKIHGKKGSRPWSPFSRSMVTPRLGLDTSGKMPEPLGAFMCVGFASNLMSRLGGCFLGTLVDSTLVVLYFWLWFDDGGLFVVLSPAIVPKLGALSRWPPNSVFLFLCGFLSPTNSASVHWHRRVKGSMGVYSSVVFLLQGKRVWGHGSYVIVSMIDVLLMVSVPRRRG